MKPSPTLSFSSRRRIFSSSENIDREKSQEAVSVSSTDAEGLNDGSPAWQDIRMHSAFLFRPLISAEMVHASFVYSRHASPALYR